MKIEEGFTLCILLILITFLAATIIVTSYQTKDSEIILKRTETGITCKIDKYYPETNCKLLVEALGKRLSELKVEK